MVCEQAPQETGEVIFKGVVAGIISDVLKGIESLPEGFDREDLKFELANAFKKEYQSLQISLWRARRVLRFCLGQGFSSLTPEEQRGKIYEVSDKDPEILKRKLEVLYAEYQASGDDHADKWSKFANAFAVFGGSIDRGYDCRIVANFPVVFRACMVRLPDSPRDLDYWATEDERQENTVLQTSIARSIEVLGDRGSWERFLKSPLIQIIPPDAWQIFHSREEDSPSLVQGIQKGSGWKGLEPLHQGMSFYYSSPTKYEGVRAHIEFTTPISGLDSSLDDLLRENKSTPQISLKIPTEVMFQSV